MKYAFMSFSTPSSTLAEMIEIARRFGYDGLEPRLDAKHAHGIEASARPEERRAIVDRVSASPVELCCLATSLRYADPADEADVVRESHARIDLAGDLKVPALRVFGGKIPEGMARERAIDHVASVLASLAGHAAERGVTLCMETHDDWCDPGHVAAVLQRVDHTAIAVNWDIMHPVRVARKSIDEAFEVLKPWIRHLHVHDGTWDETLTLLPIGAGDVDHRRALELMMQSGYEGFISGEWIRWEPGETHLPRELAVLKKYEQELGNE